MNIYLHSCKIFLIKLPINSVIIKVYLHALKVHKDQE